jgi:enoyl-CoA hydratase
MSWTTMSLTHDGAVAHVQLSRAAQFNTMVPAFWTEMIDVFKAIDAHAGTRAVVLSSTGKHFTAGLDLVAALGSLQVDEPDPARVREKLRRKILAMQETFSVIDRCRVPVIAVIQGGCIGGGVDLATACDLRVGTRDCFFSVQEINVGIVADVGTLQRLPTLLPQGLVRELAYTGRRFLAAEAERYGLLNRVLDSHEAALEAGMALAREIAGKSPLAITGIKQVLNHGRGRTVEDGLDHVATWNAGMLIGHDLDEAVRATLEKRAAAFADLVA